MTDFLRTLGWLTIQSLKARRGTVLLAMLSIAVSVALVIAVERVRVDAKASFANTISGTDLLVGARSSPLNLLLYSVFRIGDATAGMSWHSFTMLAEHPQVAWAVPLSLGDAHRGYRVLGTTAAYFEHYRFADARPLTFSAGNPFQSAASGDAAEAILGADVARDLGYRLGTEIVISHGIGQVSFQQHSDQPLTVSGILARTGTPVDRTVHVPLAAIDAIHAPEAEHESDEAHQEADHADHHEDHHEDEAQDHSPAAITAALVGLKARSAVLRLQREINEYPQEALLAAIPGVTLSQLWRLLRVAELALFAVSGCVVFAGLVGLLATQLTSLGERRRELAILRSLGARPRWVFWLLGTEAAGIALIAALLGTAVTYLGLLLLRDTILDQFGFALAAGRPGWFDAVVIGAVTLASGLIALIPAWRLYRQSLTDGLRVTV